MAGEGARRYSVVTAMAAATLLAGGLLVREEAEVVAKRPNRDDERRERERQRSAATREHHVNAPRVLTAADEERIRLAEAKRARKAAKARSTLSKETTNAG